MAGAVDSSSVQYIKNSILKPCGHNYINGRFVESYSKEIFESRGPAHISEILGIFAKSNTNDVSAAVDATKKAFPTWRALGSVKRAEYVWRAARFLEDTLRLQNIILSHESGKILNEGFADVTEALHMLQYAFAYGHIGKEGDVFRDEVAQKLCLVLNEPRGIVVAISPWNFPRAIPEWLVALPLITGNVVILKPSEETPWCGELVAQSYHKAGIPPGVFQVVQGMGETVGWDLVKHKSTNTILFTGSYEVGAKIKKEVAKYPHKNCSIETGSKSAVIVLKDANLDMAVNAAIASAFKTSGQRCVSGGRVIIERPIFEQFVERFIEKAKHIKTGDPFDPDVFHGPMINQAGVEKGLRFNQLADDENCDILLDRNGEDPPTKDGYWLRPFVYSTEWDRTKKCLTEEAFSPHVALIPADSAEAAIAIYNDTEYGLSGAVFTNSIHQALATILELDCGITYHNLPCIGAGVRMPFGGRKKSGGLTSSAAGLIPAITHQKAITLNLAEEIVMAQGLSIKT